MFFFAELAPPHQEVKVSAAWFSPAFATSGPGCKEISPSLFANQDLRFSKVSLGGSAQGVVYKGFVPYKGWMLEVPKPLDRLGVPWG